MFVSLMLHFPYRQLGLLLMLPAIEVALYAGLVGGDVKDVKLLFDNNDTGEVISYPLCSLYVVASLSV